jgi:hypothetical protein
MKKFIFLCLLLPLSLWASEGLQNYKNEALNYSISVPASWLRRDQKIPGHSSVIEFISPKHEGSLLIMPVEEEATTCRESLKKLEEERKLTNVLPAAKRILSTADLKDARAQEGVQAQYDFPPVEKVQAVQQNAWCLRQGAKKRILLGTFKKANGPEMFEAIFKSFAFLDKK